MKKPLCLLAALLIMLAGCKDSAETFKTIDEIAKTSELKPELTSASLNYGGNLIKSGRLSKVLPLKEGFLFFSFPEKAAFVCDYSLNVKKKIQLTAKYTKELSERIFDVFINGDTLFICDNSMSIKKVNLPKEELSEIPLKGMTYFSQPYYLGFTKEGHYVYTFNPLINTTKDKIPGGDLVVGAVFSPGGVLQRQIAVNKDLFSHTAAGKDMAIYSELGNKRYLCFRLDKNIVSLGGDFSSAGKAEFYLNKEWSAPKVVNKKFAAYVVNHQQLQNYKDWFIHRPPAGKNSAGAGLVIYDAEFNPLQRVSLPDLNSASDYSYSVSGNKMAVFSESSTGNKNIYIYDLTKL